MERTHDHDRSLYKNIRSVTILMKRLAVPHELEKGVVLPPRLGTLDAECTAGTATPCGWSRCSSSLKVVPMDDESVGEEVDDACDGLSSAGARVA